jgi:hypothetical protein
VERLSGELLLTGEEWFGCDDRFIQEISQTKEEPAERHDFVHFAISEQQPGQQQRWPGWDWPEAD